ncbi:MAG TPA: SDR family NAD(P)-dependent oxidoreductase [Thiomicrospira sp.]|nr:SDR family NAD(P)-dependent oxidoreductase [Thiomicrospira sp.]
MDINQVSPGQNFTAMIFGATGGIGHAMVLQILSKYPSAKIYRFARNLNGLLPIESSRPSQIDDYCWDLNNPEELLQSLKIIQIKNDQTSLKLDFVFIASGFLHDKNQQPEKSYNQIKGDFLMRSYKLNAVGPILVLQTLLEKMDLKHPCKIGVLSARVGSISDNRMGGWHSYRSSKAALNMLLKNFAIELLRKRLPITLVGLQPGTTDTDLSKPFTKRIDSSQLQSAEYTAESLFRVLQGLTPEQSGQLFDFNGESFEP